MRARPCTEAALGYQLSDTVKLFGRAMNLADKRHATAASYTASKGEEFAPGMPRTFFIGVETGFK